MSAPRFPRSVCKVVQPCTLCPQRIRPGMKIGKDFATNEWVHIGCLIRKIHAGATAA